MVISDIPIRRYYLRLKYHVPRSRTDIFCITKQPTYFRSTRLEIKCVKPQTTEKNKKRKPSRTPRVSIAALPQGTALPGIDSRLADRHAHPFPPALSSLTARNRPLAPPIHGVGVPRDACIVAAGQRLATAPDVDAALPQALGRGGDVGVVAGVVLLELLLAVHDAGRVRGALEDEPARRGAAALDPRPALAQPPLGQRVPAAVAAELLPRHAAQQPGLGGQPGCVPALMGWGVGGGGGGGGGGFGLFVG